MWPRAKPCLVLGYRFAESHPPWSCHASCHTPVLFGRYDNSMAGGRLVCAPHYLCDLGRARERERSRQIRLKRTRSRQLGALLNTECLFNIEMHNLW